ncbi:MAG: universal stress protein [Pseudomonadales bacterium]
MAQFPSHVLATVDPAATDELALNTAASIARDHNAQTSALAILPPPMYIQRGTATLEVDFEQDLSSAVVAGLKATCTDLGLAEACANVSRGRVHEAVEDYAKENDVDLVCVGLHERDLEEYFLGTTATAVLRHVNADVYGCRTGLATGYYRNVIVALDSGDDALSRSMLAKTKQFLAPYPNADVHIRHVMRPLAVNWAGSLEDYASSTGWQELNSELIRATEDGLGALVADESLVASSVEVLHGQPSSKIKEEVQALSADLLIMGTGAHIGIGWHIGSTTNNVMHGVGCDVLAIRPA